VAQPELTMEKRLELVTIAIERCEHFDEARRHYESLPSSSSHDRSRARLRLTVAENEFGWQWRNVREILKGKQ
jgi:hypothetical protein